MRFPIIYATDADYFFGALVDLSKALQTSGEVSNFILVGIGYDNAEDAALLRARDFYTRSIRASFHDALFRYVRSPSWRGAADLSSVTHGTDAADFLQFIREELMPFVNSRYAPIIGDASYFGASAGGTFGLYTLFCAPNTFRRYLLASPGTIHHGRKFALELASKSVSSLVPLTAQVFATVGELEEFDHGLEQSNLVSGLYELISYLRATSIPGLQLCFKVLPQETHATSWAIAFVQGLRAFFTATEISRCSVQSE